MFLYNDILIWVSAIILLELIMGASAIFPSRHVYQRVSVLPWRRRRQQLSPLSTPCIPLLPSLVDCQMPHDDTVVVIFVVIASVISS